MSDGGPPNSTSPGRWVFREFILDEDRAELRRGDNRIDMRAQSFAVLRLLVINHGRLVSRDTLLDEVWGDKIVTEDSLTHCLGDIRRALGDASQDMIRTVRGRGYIFEASVREEGVGRAQTAIAEAAATLWAGLKWQQLAAISASIVALIAIGLWMVGAQNDPIENVDIDRSIAVLPFVNMSSDPEQDYFSDGISEEILNLLAKVHQLRVVSRSSSFVYRGDGINIPEVGKALNVGYVLEGSVRKAGDSIRITAQLIEAATDKHLWSETYDRQLIDVFAIQDEVSAHIIDQLRIELTGEAPHAYRTDPETYALFLRAKARVANVGLMGDSQAVRMMDEVVARDPEYVPGMMYFASMIGYESRNFGDQALYQGEEAERKIQELVDRTLALDPNNAQALMRAARTVATENHDFPRAARMIEKALEQNASDAILILRPAMGFAQIMGDFESRLRLGKRAVEVDPSCFHCMSDYVVELVRAGRLDEAEALARTRIAIAPNGEIFLGDVYMARGDYEKAFEVFADIPYEGVRLVNQARALFAKGDLPGFQRLKKEFSEEDGGPLGMAVLYAVEGDTEAAIASIRLAFSESIEMFGFTMRDPIFEGLHGKPGWEELRERSGLTDANLQGVKLNLPDGF